MVAADWPEYSKLNLAGPNAPAESRLRSHFDKMIVRVANDWTAWNDAWQTQQQQEPHAENNEITPLTVDSATALYPVRWPFMTLRLVESIAPDGTPLGPFVGEIATGRWLYDYYLYDKTLQEQLISANNARLPGDPDLVWMIGYIVRPEFRKQGIAKDAVDVIVEWLHNVMRARVVVAACAIENIVSAKLLEKCGFFKVKEYETEQGRDVKEINFFCNKSNTPRNFGRKEMTPKSLPLLPNIYLTPLLATDWPAYLKEAPNDIPETKLKEFFDKEVQETAEIWDAWNNAYTTVSLSNGDISAVRPSSWPFAVIRLAESISEDGTIVGPYIGEVSAKRWKYDYYLTDKAERDGLIAENNARTPGDPEIVYMIGYGVNSEFRKKGIASAAANAVVDWLHNFMNARVVVAACAVENIASAGLLSKCGFVKVKEYETKQGRHNFGGMISWEHVVSREK
ncbi:hypothetical protein HK100_008576 [Physocladia obscura]|uniref:N-acetyltransferase domain-containing protein n=1 Tax=Physocladia obscura TaxID=109957 RepID=A0AAD5TBU4_9FUNG|nr:hypothetical protein HK100_008576 [Physocladia obscura]